MDYNFEKLVVHSQERPGKDKYYILSSKKIRNNFNWKEEISINDGIDRCIGWVKKNLKSFSKLDEIYSHKK